jgi:signal transduction histidine kinase
MSLEPSHPEFLLTFAHDLRQSLRTVVMQTQRIQRMGDGDVSDAVKARLDEIVAAARRQEELIASVVEFDQAGQEGGEDTLTPIPFKLAIQTACMKVEAYRKQCADSTIRFEHRAGPGCSVPSTFARVVEKVLHNALKFRERGLPAEIGIETDSGGVVRIVDAGLGIEPRYRETVFEPFRRLHAASEYPGCGLGLAICRRLMTAMGGEIAIEDPGPERGVAVRIRVPVSPVD